MGTIKENPNDIQIKQARTTRPEDLEKERIKEYLEIEKKKEKKVNAGPDEGASDEKPFDAESNNIHLKR